MSLDKLNKNQFNADADADGTSTGDQTSGIGFKDFISVSAHRDDLLPPDEKKRLLIIHQELHEERVKKEKATRAERVALKNGKISLNDFRQKMTAVFKENPALRNKAQFSGVDQKVNPLSTENVAETNEANRNELENRFENRLRLTNAPRFNPKPTFGR